MASEPQRSRWNLWLDRVSAADLAHEELRLAVVLAREVLGWNVEQRGIGEKRLRASSKLHGRSLERARDGLREKGLIEFTAGTRGRAGAAVYRLMLRSEMPAPARANDAGEMPAPRRANRPKLNARAQSAEMPARERVHRVLRGKTPGEAGTTPSLLRDVFDAYLGAGGSLQLERDRGALARQAAALVKSGMDEQTILAAAKDLGRRREFTGYLKQRAEDIAATGGVCEWEAFGRSGLTRAQLDECGCARCAEWAAAHESSAAPIGKAL